MFLQCVFAMSWCSVSLSSEQIRSILVAVWCCSMLLQCVVAVCFFFQYLVAVCLYLWSRFGRDSEQTCWMKCLYERSVCVSCHTYKSCHSSCHTYEGKRRFGAYVLNEDEFYYKKTNERTDF